MHPISSKSFGQKGILCLFSNDSTLLSGWVTRQIGARRFIVTDGTVTKVCTLASTTADAASLPDGQCTFVVSPQVDVGLPDEYVESINSVRLGTTAGNAYSWHRTTPTASIARIINNVQYYNIEQGLIHAAPISGLAYGASFSLTQAAKVRVRLCLASGESEGVAPQFTITLQADSDTFPGTVLATHTYADATTLGLERGPFLEFTDASAVSLSAGRYWIIATDGPNTGEDTSGACWFWETNNVDATVKNEYNYSSYPSPAPFANSDNFSGFQMCVELL